MNHDGSNAIISYLAVLSVSHDTCLPVYLLERRKKDCIIIFIATTVPCFGLAAHARHVVLVLVVDTTSS
jgi:hypothetical protein